MSQYHHFLTVCEDAVRRAGSTIQAWIGKTHAQLKGPADFVTEADWASQESIRTTVLGAFSDHSLLGEEGYQPGAKRATPYRWIADPLDGTTNFVHSVPHYCVSVALEHEGEVLVGAIYDPTRNECFTAALGGGAFLNGRPIRTSAITQLSDALAATGFPAHATRDSLDVLVFNEAVFQVQGLRRMGSAALNLAYLAAGRLDALWAFSTKIWDVAAGTLLVREAGGIVTSPEGGDFVLEDACYIAAANPALYAGLKEMVARVMGRA